MGPDPLARTMAECAESRPAVVPRAKLAATFNPWDDWTHSWPGRIPRTWDQVFDKAEAGDAAMLRFLGSILLRDVEG